MQAAKALLAARCPLLRDESKDYCESILEQCSDDFASSDDVYQAIGPIIADVDSDADVELLCAELYQLFQGSSKDERKEGDDHFEPQRESAHAAASAAEAYRTSAERLPSIWYKGADDMRQMSVDVKKLSKAEAKIREKKETRKHTPINNSAVRAATAKNLTASEAINRRDEAIQAKSNDIRLDDFDMAFQDEKLLLNAEMTLAYGRRYALVGRNGVGKSTLLRLLATGELTIPKHISILFVEQEAEADETTVINSVLASDEKRQRLLSEAEKLSGGARLANVYEQLAAIDADSAPARAARLLAGLGFVDQSVATRELSGGWRMRLALARALFASPVLLILDEPTNYLDMRTVLWLQHYLKRWPSTLLVVSHDRRFLNKVASDIIHLHGRKLHAYRGNYDEFLLQRAQRRRQQQHDYDAQQLLIKRTEVFIDAYRLTGLALVQSRMKMLQRLKRISPPIPDEPIEFSIPHVDTASSVAFRLEDCTFRYSPSSPNVFTKANVTAGADARIVVVGANGAGKSTMLKLLLDQLKPTDGFVFRDRRLRVQYFAQHHVDALDGNLRLSALQCLEQRHPCRREADYSEALTRFALDLKKHAQPLETLSGGEKTRVALALMMSFTPVNFLIFDEVSSHMDTETVEALGAALKRFNGGVLLVSHDEFLVELVCNELWVCENARVEVVGGGYPAYRRRVKRELKALKVSAGGVKPAAR